ncbi:hypothetical protein TCDM_13550 [Trypanosoma cruzi Dm28c]|uniref:ATPase n=1 Tax=Trypanosoma cruzi Dm28c TaxID=1416333 RepID=V5ASE0_TRYCR|nr:hypothetical protein TCDM_13550 [Trypanosoma cruzi Dm28c]
MRRGRDERRAEGAVTCGRAARACGAEHTFFSFCFVFLRPGLADTRSATHTATPCRFKKGILLALLDCSSCFACFFFCCSHSPDGVTRLPSCLRASLSPHTHE